MTAEDIAGECAAELKRRGIAETTGQELLAYYDHRYRGEVWPLMELHIGLFPERMPAIDDPAPPVKGDLRWDAEHGAIRTWTGEAWWPNPGLAMRSGG